METFLELKNIKKYFGGVKALDGVDINVQKGRIHYLAGENGSGKSTLIKVISGVHQPTDGELYINNQLITDYSPIDALKHGIQVIYQDFAIFPNLSVAENISANRYLIEGKKTVNYRGNKKKAIEVMQRINIDIDPDELVENLSVANKQLVAICRALVNDVQMLILDEPTTALTAKEVLNLNKVVKELQNHGIAIVIVNHKLEEVFTMADDITILRNGVSVASGTVDKFSYDTFTEFLLGRSIELKTFDPKVSDETILSIENLNSGPLVKDVSFNVKKGEIIGLTGLLSSGRQELGDCLFGLRKIDSGTIRLNGKELVIKSIQDAMDAKIAYVPEDRLTQGLFMNRTIQDNVVSANLKKYYRNMKLDDKMMFNTSKEWIKKLQTKAPGPKTIVSNLSGGNAQKVVLSKWLDTKPDLIVLNGPTVGVDIGSKVEIHMFLQELASQGVGVIIISDDITELLYSCNRLIVMWDGEVKDNVLSKDLDQSQLTTLISSELKYIKAKEEIQ